MLGCYYIVDVGFDANVDVAPLDVGQLLVGLLVAPLDVGPLDVELLVEPLVALLHERAC